MLTVVGVAFAKPQTAYQISDGNFLHSTKPSRLYSLSSTGQVQVNPYPASSSAVASSPVVITTPIASDVSAPVYSAPAVTTPAYSAPVVTTPVPYVPASSVSVAPVNSSSAYVAPLPPSSPAVYPVPVYNSTMPAGSASAPIMSTGAIATYGKPTPVVSSSEAGAYGTNTTPAPAVATGAGGMLEVQSGIFGAALIALAGVLA